MTADIKLKQMCYTCLLKRKNSPTLCSQQSKRCVLSEVQKYFFLKKVFVGFSHILVSNVFGASSAFTKLTDKKGPLLDGGGKKNPLKNPVCLTEKKKNSAPLIFQGVKIPHLEFSARLWHNSFVKKRSCGLATETGDKTRKVC